MIAGGNKDSERESKESIYSNWLKPRFDNLKLDEIVADGHVADFKATLSEAIEAGTIGPKRANNILCALNTALKYAADQQIIDAVPNIGLFTVEDPEIVWWDFDEYRRIVLASVEEGPCWHIAVCLAGEAGLRVGEIRALVWERDVDLIGRTITVNRQVRKGREGTPKGGKRRTIPMTSTLLAALKSLAVVRRGFVVRNDDGSWLRDGQTTHGIYRVCRRAKLPERAWHVLRHSMGTHAAMFGVNPWRLMAWMGHKSVSTTMKYVHVADSHMRPLPGEVLAKQEELDPDRRIIAMLGARACVAGNHVATPNLSAKGLGV